MNLRHGQQAQGLVRESCTSRQGFHNLTLCNSKVLDQTASGKSKEVDVVSVKKGQIV